MRHNALDDAALVCQVEYAPEHRVYERGKNVDKGDYLTAAYTPSAATAQETTV